MLLNNLGLRMSKIKISKNLSNDELEYLLEAAFFALSRPLRINEIAEILDEEERRVRSVVKKVRKKMKKEELAFGLDEIATDVFMMKINENLEDNLKVILKEEDFFHFNHIEIDVLTTIAYQQPIRKSDLLKMMDQHKKSEIIKAFDVLRVEEYITESKEKNTIIVRTTSRFSLEFGFSTELRSLKQQLHWRLRRNA